MEASQREYFVTRLNEIEREKIKAKAVELYGPSGRPEQPTWGQVFEAIKAGEITLKDEKRDYTGPYLNPQDVVWPAMEAKAVVMEAYRRQLAIEKQKAMDAVMLEDTAQTALSNFAAV